MTTHPAKAVDTIQKRLVDYASVFGYDTLTPDAIHGAKVRIIDTLGALLSGFFGEPCQIARNLAAQAPDEHGVTVIGTRMKAGVDMAAFVNGLTVLYTEMTDVYHWPGSSGGHPSDVVAPALACAEHVHANGRDLIANVVLAYEIYLRFNDNFKNPGFDHVNFCCLASAIAGSRLFGLSPGQLAHAISMAVVPNNALRITRVGHQTMWKTGAAAVAARSGVFAALLARAGMEGPHLPFEGKAGWCEHIALEQPLFGSFGGKDTRFKILDTSIKMRPASAFAITAILAAEQIGPLRNSAEVQEVTVEMYKKAKDAIGTSAYLWNPQTKEVADHSAPYMVAVALVDGNFSSRAFDDAHLHNPAVRALMQKIKVIENPQFTEDFNRQPVQQRARITVLTGTGEKLVGSAGEGRDDLATPKTDAQIEEKFRTLTEDYLGSRRVCSVLDMLWGLENLEDVTAIAPQLVIT